MNIPPCGSSFPDSSHLPSSLLPRSYLLVDVFSTSSVRTSTEQVQLLNGPMCKYLQAAAAKFNKKSIDLVRSKDLKREASLAGCKLGV